MEQLSSYHLHEMKKLRFVAFNINVEAKLKQNNKMDNNINNGELFGLITKGGGRLDETLQ